MKRASLAIFVVWASLASADCRPEGRDTFTAGLEALARGEWSAAAARFGALVQAQPDCAEARNNLAVVEVEQGGLEDAAEQLRVAVGMRPDYERARVNLQRVEALLAQQAAAPPATPAAAAPVTATVRHTESPTRTGGAAAPTPTPTPTATASPALAAEKGGLPPGILALEPQGATAAVIDPAQRRLCPYTRTAAGISGGECYRITAFQVGAWPGWLITGDTGGQRMRLYDETGQRRMKIIPEHGGVAGDVVRLRQSDFDSLVARVTPWRTAWVVMAESAPALADETTLASVRETIERWRSAWEGKRLDDYVSHYSQTFVPQSEPDVAHWRARKRDVFEHAGSIAVQIGPPSVFAVAGGTTVITLFEQWYRSGTTASHDLKALRWRRDGANWEIGAETVLRQDPPPLRATGE